MKLSPFKVAFRSFFVFVFSKFSREIKMKTLLCRDVGRAVPAGQAAAAEASAASRRPQRQDLPQARTHRAGAQEHPVGRLPRALTTR